MESLRRGLAKLPPWIFTAITMAFILWLTLAPHPLGDNMPPLFPGADKIVHAIMFGGLTLMILLDYQRRRRWKKPGAVLLVSAALISSVTGALIEVVQRAMDMGRGFDSWDIVADIAGAVLASAVWWWINDNWTLSGQEM